MSEIKTKPACTEKVHKVRRHELPLSCPADGMVLWNAHPKVYLPLEAESQLDCPYCGTHYILQDD